MTDVSKILAALSAVGITQEQVAAAAAVMNSGKIVFQDLNLNPKGDPIEDKPKATIANLKILLRHYGYSIRYNEMTKKVDIDVGSRFRSDIDNMADIGGLIDRCVLHNIATGNIMDSIYAIGRENSFHPVREWIDSHKWDGQDRLQEFCDLFVLEVPNPLKDTILRKWLLSLVAALYHPRFSCEGVLTLTGAQGVYKTSGIIEALIPREYINVWNKDAVTLDMNNKDSVFKALATWITELGELGATFKKSDIEQLKGFITEKVDVLRPPYGKTANDYARRTVFYATVNQSEFLNDDENRRFWVLAIISVLSGNFDRAQLWAQMREEYRRVAPLIGSRADREANQEWGWFMSPTERELLSATQNIHKTVDPVIETLTNRVVPLSSIRNHNAEWLNATAILQRVEYRTITKRETSIVGKWLKDAGFTPDSKKRYYVEISDRVIDPGDFKTQVAKPANAWD